MTERGRFLDMVAGALRKQRRRAVTPEPVTHLAEGADEVARLAEAVRKRAREEAGPLLEALQASAKAAGWIVHRAGSYEDAADTILEICRAAGARTAVTARTPVLDAVPVERALKAAGIEVSTAARPQAEPYSDDARRLLRAAVFTADIGITGADYAIAETGTVVLRPRQGLSRLVSLAPPRHIAVVERGQVLPSLDELFLLERHALLDGNGTSSFNLISGPSKTGDIAATIVQGIHGPVEVHLVLIG